MREMPYELDQLGPLQRRLYLGIGRIRPGQQQVVAQGLVEEVSFLGDYADGASQVFLGVATNLIASQPDFAVRRVPEA